MYDSSDEKLGWGKMEIMEDFDIIVIWNNSEWHRKEKGKIGNNIMYWKKKKRIH